MHFLGEAEGQSELGTNDGFVPRCSHWCPENAALCTNGRNGEPHRSIEK
jgi:hypothetical protein